MRSQLTVSRKYSPAAAFLLVASVASSVDCTATQEDLDDIAVPKEDTMEVKGWALVAEKLDKKWSAVPGTSEVIPKVAALKKEVLELCNEFEAKIQDGKIVDFPASVLKQKGTELAQAIKESLLTENSTDAEILKVVNAAGKDMASVMSQKLQSVI